MQMQVAREDTIVARATPRGASALSIVRLSGPNARAIATSVFEGQDLQTVPSHTAHVGFLAGADGVDVDQVVSSVFVAPGTATGEDIVEFTCHGGDVASDAALRLLVRAGARYAEPGEFTLRAFLNGKVDLAQAEAIGELIHARSQRASRVSMAHLRGVYSDELSAVRSGLMELIALVELELDFAEEDVEFADRARLEGLLDGAIERLSSLLASYRLGAALSKGVRVVIAGKPNAGKSTLMNALVGYDRVMVSDIPGTTRDEVDAQIEFEGVSFQFVDTAGLRETTDVLEAEGVRRSEAAFSTADLILYMHDLTDAVTDEVQFVQTLKKQFGDLNVLRIGNKVDAVSDVQNERYDSLISAATMDESQLRDLMQLIYANTAGDVVVSDEQQVVTSQRHRAHLESALEAASRASVQLRSGGSGDLLSADVRVIIEQIGSITGEVTNEDILGKIFSSFCIGK